MNPRRFLSYAVALGLVVCQLAAASGPAQQPPRPQSPEQFINRVREMLSLNEAQVAQLRSILEKRTAKITELRNLLAAQPYAPKLQADIETEQRAIREELAAVLTEEQKAKLAGVDLRLVQPPPAFIPARIPPRARRAGALPTERLLPPVNTDARGRARLTEEQRILHLLNRIGYGPRPGDIDVVKRLGADRFVEEQLHPETIDDSELEKRLSVLPTQQLSAAELLQFYPQPDAAAQRAQQRNPPPIFGRPQQIVGELQQRKLVRAASSNRQLLEVMTDFWFNHFNVFAQKGADLWFITSYESEVIRPNALGKFRDLLLATAQSPAMLFYLDNWLSAASDSRRPEPPRPPGPAMAGPSPEMPAPPRPSPEMRASQQPAQLLPSPPPPPAQQRRPGINENYARELMELHTMGVDGGYTQKDVQEVARCFTGWTIDRPFQGGGFVFRPWMHDTGSKTVLGVQIPAGGGISDGYRVIDILARHPATAKFVSRKLCQRFVADSPPPQLVERVAQVFLKTDGDIRAMLRTILTSAEFYSPAAFRAKVKSPLELVASALRALDGDTNGGPQLHEWLRRMGGPLYQCQAPTGYSEESSRWLSSGALLARLNFGVALANNQIAGSRYEVERLALRDNSDTAELVNNLAAIIVHTELSSETRRAVELGMSEGPGRAQSQAAVRAAAQTGPQPEASPAKSDQDASRRRTVRAIELLLGSAEFQRK